MTFLALSLVVLAACYAWSALLGEILFRSPAERVLPGVVRVGLGFLVSTLWFSAAWQWMSIGQAWALGLAVLAAYAFPAALRAGRAGVSAGIRRGLSTHARGLMVCMALGIVFFGPLIVAGKLGPFTEGGGDITIYADGARFHTSQGLTSRGVPPPSSWAQLADAVRDATLSDIDPQVRNRLTAERYAAIDKALANPPAADNAVYRLMVSQSMPPTPYVAYGTFDFLATDTNYHVYFGIQAFVYALLVAASFFALPRAPLRVRLLLLAMVAMSHSLVSIFYNMYAAQGLAVAVSAILLASIWTIRPLSAPGLRVYGTILSYLWMGYVHYLSIGAPLVLAALALPRAARADASGDDATMRPAALDRLARALRGVAVTLAAALFAVMMASVGKSAFMFVTGLAKGRLAGDTNWFMGDKLPVLSLHWASFLAGAVSQQHYRPFAFMSEWVAVVIGSGVALGLAAAAFGALIAVRVSRTPGLMPAAERRFHLVLYAVIAVTLLIHIYWAQTYIYTQAKGAQNVLVLVYAALCLPLAMACGHFANARVRRDVRIVWWSLVAFTLTLAIVRGVYGLKLSLEHDRSGIMQGSFFTEARKVRERDAEAFVLFEPRKSADLYVSIQPFSGTRMVPVRHLGLLWIDWDRKPPADRKVDPAELIHPGDLPHLWIVRYAANDRRWVAERLADGPKPRLVITADDYVQDQSRRPRSADVRDSGLFSYVRTGTTLIFMPAGPAAEIELKLVPREEAQQAGLREQVAAWVKKSGTPMTHDSAARFETLRVSLPGRSGPVLVPLVRFTGEYLVNVRVDGKDVRSRAGDEQVSGRLALLPGGNLSVTASWAGVAVADKQDWIGLFPLGGDDNTRMQGPRFTGGKSQGTMTFDIASEAMRAPPPYELRLYRANTWELLGTSEPLVPERAAGAPR